MDNWEITLNLGEKIPGKELLTLLEKIAETGSLNRAVHEAGMSYRYGWGLLKRAEEALEKMLVIRQTGGTSGGGTTLTTEGKLLLGHMQTLQREVQGQLSSFLTQQERQPAHDYLLLASTMEPVVTGLLDVLEQAYLQETGVIVRHIAAGSGQALDMAKAGRADMVLTHAPQLEEEFVKEGWGAYRRPVMKNDIILVGPKSDPAAASTAPTAIDAMRKIASADANFISRGDRSGTHLFEQKLWQLAGINPEGRSWYQKAVSTLGNYGLLHKAADVGGYTLVDRASYSTGYHGRELAVLTEGDPILQNIFSIIPLSRLRAAVNQAEAERFAFWLCSAAAQKVIAGFGKQQYGFPLFQPIGSA